MYYSPKILALLLLGTLTRNANGVCDDLVIEVSQGDKEYTFNTVDTHQTVEDFYDYDSNYGYNGLVETHPDSSMMFVHRNLLDNDDCELSFVVVNDHSDYTPCKVRFWFSGDIKQHLKVQDDPSDTFVIYNWPATGVKKTDAFWNFNSRPGIKGCAFTLGKEFDCFSVTTRVQLGIDLFTFAAPSTKGGTDFAYTPLDRTAGADYEIQVCMSPQTEDPEILKLKCTAILDE
jgi:hypothetical protein